MLFRRLALSLFALLVLVAAIAPTAGAAGLTNPRWHGVQVTGIRVGNVGNFDRDLTEARKLGANVVRTDIDWGQLEPHEGRYDADVLAAADRFVASARARGIKLLLTIAGTPCWNTTAPAPAGQCRTAAQRAEAQRFQPRDLQAYARMAAFVAGRWGTDLAALEVWNEPDQRNQLYWAGPNKVKRYADLLKVTYPAVKAAAPNVTVLGAAIVGANGAFLEALYKQGIRGSYDALSVHYYDLVLLSLGQIRQIRKRYEDATPLWLAEFGWTSCLTKRHKTQDGHNCVSKTIEAQNTLDVLRVLNRQPDVQGAIVYQLRDNLQYNFGALDRNGHRKPLYKALSRAFRGKLGRSRAVRLALRKRGSGVFAVGSGPAGDALEINVWVGKTLRYRAVFRLDRNNRFNLRLPAQLGRSNLTASVKRYTVGGRAAVARTP